MGLLGSGVLIFCIFTFLRSLFPLSKLMFVIAFIVVFSSVAGFVSIRPWGYLILLLSAFSKGHYLIEEPDQPEADPVFVSSGHE